MAKLNRPQAINGIERSIKILEGMRRFFIEQEAGQDADEDYMQELLDGISDIANERLEKPGDAHCLKFD